MKDSQTIPLIHSGLVNVKHWLAKHERRLRANEPDDWEKADSLDLDAVANASELERLRRENEQMREILQMVKRYFDAPIREAEMLSPRIIDRLFRRRK